MMNGHKNECEERCMDVWKHKYKTALNQRGMTGVDSCTEDVDENK